MEKKRTINFKYGANSNNRFFYDNESPCGDKILKPFQIEYDLFQIMNGWNLLNVVDIRDLSYGYLMVGIIYKSIILTNQCIGWIIPPCLTGERIDNDQPVSHISFSKFLVNLKKIQQNLNGIISAKNKRRKSS